MSFEIVDGMTGQKHISSEDLSALNIATIGESNCVLNYGDNFKLTMTNANTATLGTGVGMVGGKRFWNQAATNLTIQSGTQGQKRNDLVVARYAKTSDGIESITPVVIKGTPTTGTAADPEVTANDLKLWRVPLDGISVGEPVKLFEPVASLATIGDSVSQLEKVQTFSSNGVNAHKAGAIVTLCAAASYDISDAWGSRTICTLPWRPRNVVSTAFAVQGGGSGVVLRVEKNGDVKVVGVGTTWRSGWLFGTLSFAVME